MARREKKPNALRTCLGCRSRRERSQMIRIVRDPAGKAVFDVEGRLQGRGAYVCPRSSCLRRLSPSSLTRHLRAPVVLPRAEVLQAGLLSACRRKVRDLLTIGLKAGHVRIGAREALEAIDARRAVLLLLASDTSAGTQRRLLRAARGVTVQSVGAKAELGAWLGRAAVGSAVVTEEGLAGKMRIHLDRLTSIQHNSYHAGQP